MEKSGEGHRQIGLFDGNEYPIRQLDPVASAVEQTAIGTVEQSGAPLLEGIGYRLETDAGQKKEKVYTS